MTPEALEAFMKRLNYKTATDLAKALGRRRDTVSRWLNGETEISKSDRLAMSALAHGLPPME